MPCPRHRNPTITDGPGVKEVELAMEHGAGNSGNRGFSRWLVRRWFALTRRKIRLLEAADVAAEGPILLVVSHPAGFLHSLALVTAVDRPVHCLLPKNLVPGFLARLIARQLGVVLFERVKPTSELTPREAADVLASDGAVVLFADQHSAGTSAASALASTAETIVSRAELQHPGTNVTVYPVHLFLPQPPAPSREILIYVDSPLVRSEHLATALSQDAGSDAFVAALESRFRDNAFQLRPTDLDYFIGDLEEVLRTGLREDWASRPDWKQDTEGFVLSRLVTEWVKQTNYLNPERLISLRKSLDDYRVLQRQFALREFEVDRGNSPLRPGWRRAMLWLETLLGFPVALYGFLNHLLIVLTLLLAGSFKKENDRARHTEWALRGALALGFYAVQTLLVAHWRGRAVAGYYAPTLPVSGLYLWRYLALVRTRARPLVVSLTIPGLTRKVKRSRHELLEELDRALASYEEITSVPR